MGWKQDFEEAFTELPGDIRSTITKTYDVARNDNDRDFNMSRRKFIQLAGAATLGGVVDQTEDGDLDSYDTAANVGGSAASQVPDLEWKLGPFGDSDDSSSPDDSNSQNGAADSNTPEPQDTVDDSSTPEYSETSTPVSGDSNNLNYSQEICNVHAELEEDIQTDIENYLSIVDETAGLESLSVSGKYIDSSSERFATTEITGTQGGQDQLGATEEYAETLGEAYNNEEEEFYEALNNILEGECE